MEALIGIGMLVVIIIVLIAGGQDIPDLPEQVSRTMLLLLT